MSENWLLPLCDLKTSAGTSPTLWTRGLAALGLAGTRGLASPTEDLPSFKMSPGESGESFEAGLGPASPGWTRESKDLRVPINSST